MRILVITSYPIFPLEYGGKIRTLRLTENLVQLGFDIGIIAPWKIGQPHVVGIDKKIVIHSIKYPFIFAPLLTDRPFPYQYLISYHPGYKFLVKRYLNGFDAYQFEHASFTDLIEELPRGKPIIYNSQNVEFDYVSAECRNGLIKRLAERRLYALEEKLVASSAKIFACSQEDKDRFIGLYGADKDKIEIIPNGINTERRYTAARTNIIKRFPNLEHFNKKAIFSGSNVEHNRKAVRFVFDELAPQFRDKCAFIFKGGCGKRFQYPREENIFIDPEDAGMESYAPLSPVAINPVTRGSGTSMKVLDYLAHGFPVISTEFGMRGYPDLKPFVMVCELTDFADALRQSHSLPLEVAQALKKYSWINITEKMKTIYLSL
jgi:glycosyltransferase involved in cell wall biosynthesis